MMIDAHHHLWKYNQREYRWMDDSMHVLQRDYLPGDLEQELSQTGVSGTVVVQARQNLEETRWLLGLANTHSFIKGVVGWLDLRSSELDKQLDAFAAHPKLVGLRHVLHDEPDDEFMLRKDFMNGIAQLKAYNLTYDLLLFPRHIEPAIMLVERHSRQRFVLDHLGKPLIKSGIMEPWKRDITRLAAYPNVWCKLSGMVTEADLQNWSYKELLPYMETVLEAFGPERLMLGSDWPVCRLAGEYGEVIGVVRKFIKSMDIKDQTKILYQNAIDCYQLKLIDNGEEKVQDS
ncbi:MAG: amidohydrolase family protein [Bacteroidota bacterium]|nr:amidohydrolase family protein [Bacteroidota bacterium]